MSLIGVAGWSLAACAGALALSIGYGAGYAAVVTREFPPEGRMLETAAGPIHVVEAGEGRAVLLVHGASASNRELRSALETPLVEAGFRVIAMDRPGFGWSPAFSGRDRLEGHARAVAAVIEAIGLEKPIVIGHSYGGAVALRLALDRPGLAGGYVLLGSATHGDVGPVAWFNHVGATPVAGWLFAHSIVPLVGPIIGRPGVISAFAPAEAPQGHYKATAVGLVFRPSTFLANSHDLERVNPELLAQQDRYGEITDPVAIVAGEDDHTVLTARHSERTAAAIVGSRLSLLPGVGHMPHHAAPELIVEHVRAMAGAAAVDETRIAAARG